MKIFNVYGSKERLFEIYKKINNINEELVTTLKLFNYNIEVYKNPQTLTRIKPNIRGISTPDGDFYIVDSTEIIHTVFSSQMRENGFNFPRNIYNDNNYIAWTRYGKSDDFYLGESYEVNDEKNEIEELNKQSIENVKKKNPQFNFIVKLINQA